MCKRTDIHFIVTESDITGNNFMQTREYCSAIHVCLDIVDTWALRSSVSGKKTLKRLFLTALALLEKIERTAKKEWVGTAAKVK